ncbi:MAG TPA: hypothetical protein VFK02_03080 [Kofleriaceae bacterium]|nr:hypothetical protein [Kofleriaceae bacterium]
MPRACAAPHAGALVSTPAHSPTGVDLYAGLIGSWSVDVTDYGDDGSVHRDTGEWHFSRILDGRGVQDVWISPPRSARGPSYAPGPFDRFGTSIRTPLAGGETWKVIWLNPVRNVEVQLIGRRVGNHIRADAFHWLGEISTDAGKTWSVEQEMHLRRRR